MAFLSNHEDESTYSSGWMQYLASATVVFSLLLVVVYVITGLLVGDFSAPLSAAIYNPDRPGSIIVLDLAQCQDPAPIVPTSLLTSMFLHSGILHIASNIVFLLFFGFILEENLPKTKWILTFLLTGFIGNVTFALAGIAGLFGSQIVCGVGASGAVYGIMGTALGWRVAILVIFLAGLDIFAGGGLFAHIGGLIAGFAVRYFWISRNHKS